MVSISADNVKKFFLLRTMNAKIILGMVLFCLILVTIIEIAFNIALNYVVKNQIMEREVSDIKHLEMYLGEGEWCIHDGALYKGDVLIGDGTEEHANKQPFEKFEELTGTFAYAAMICSDEGLKNWVGDEESGYKEGHYIRVAGSTKKSDGSSIVGTYIDKIVADSLDYNGYFGGDANVDGERIYSYYEVIRNAENKVVGYIVVGRNFSEINHIVGLAKQQVNVIVIALIVIFTMILIILFARLSKSVETIKSYLKLIGTGEYPKEKLKINSHDEIEDVSNSINDMVSSLVDKDRIGAELNIATKIQIAMLPKNFPNKQAVDLHAIMSPAREVGGDFYDFEMKGNDLYFAIGDVSGKGIPAAIVMAITKSAFRMYNGLRLPMEQVVAKVNNSIAAENEVGMFVTLFVARLNLETMELEYCNAGHNPIVIIPPDGWAHFLEEKTNVAVGVVENFVYEGQKIKLEKGTSLALYTDGVTEAEKVNKEQFGNDRLLSWANMHAHDLSVDATTACNDLYNEVMKFADGNEQNDDITIITMRV